jgi:predicted nucleic acid-binding protein
MTKTDAFFDTNVLIYFATTEDAKSDLSERAMRGGGVVSVQVLNEFVNVTRRKYRMPWSDVTKGLMSIRAICTVAPLTLETHERAVSMSERYQLNIYDAMSVAAAQLAGCKTLYSEDIHHGLVIDSLKIVNPFK